MTERDRGAAGTVRRTAYARTTGCLSPLVGHTQVEDYASMSVVAVVIAGVAALVSVVALFLGERRACKRSRLDEAIETRARKADQRDEERAQREEIELRSSQQGRPTTDPATREPGRERAYRFRVTNVGRSSMSHLHPELVDSSGEVCSQLLPNIVLGALQSGERAEFVLKVTQPIDRNPLFLHYIWHDATGLQERLSNVTVPTT